MSNTAHPLPLREKFGYSLGDAAANFVWRSSFFLPIFYTDTFGLTVAHAAIIMLIVRLSDGVTDIIMGSIADRTNTRNGKFRPWVLWSAPLLGLFLALVFTTPDFSYGAKVAYAFIIYFCLTLAYTANNVPYGALMGVMTSSVRERASLSAWRFGGAFGGGLLVMTLMPLLVKEFGGGNEALGYRYTMLIFAVLLVLFCVVTYKTTKERVIPVEKTLGTFKQEMKDLFANLPVILLPVFGISIFLISITNKEWDVSVKVGAGLFCVGTFVATYLLRAWLLRQPVEKMSHARQDMVDLLSNKPWLILLVVGVLFGIYTVVRPSAAGFYFKYHITQSEVSIFELFKMDIVAFYFFLTVGVSFIAAFITGYLARRFSKKLLLAVSFGLGAVFNGSIYFAQADQTTYMLTMAVIGEFFAGMTPVLFYSMLGDTADYSEWKNGRRATGLVYSAGTFINKTGHGFAGVTVMLVLAAYGYDAAVAATIPNAVEGIILLMSLIPAAFALVAIVFTLTYPLDDAKMAQIEKDLAERRAKAGIPVE